MDMDFNKKASEIVAIAGRDWDVESLATDLRLLASPLAGNLEERAIKAPAYMRINALMRGLRDDRQAFDAVAGALVDAFKAQPDQHFIMSASRDVLRREVFPDVTPV